MKQTFEIPEGCNRVTIEQQGRQIFITFEPEFKNEPKFKNGDFVCLKVNLFDKEIMCTAIFKKIKDSRTYYHVLLSIDRGLIFNNAADALWKCVGYATEEGKQKLLDAMEKDGKRWNAKANQVEEIKPNQLPKKLKNF